MVLLVKGREAPCMWSAIFYIHARVYKTFVLKFLVALVFLQSWNIHGYDLHLKLDFVFTSQNEMFCVKLPRHTVPLLITQWLKCYKNQHKLQKKFKQKSFSLLEVVLHWNIESVASSM